MPVRSTPLIAALTIIPALSQAQSSASAAPPLPLKHKAQPTTAAIDARDLMTRLYVFADDSMMGREAGTVGGLKGTGYIAAEVKRLGLRPAGDSGSYFQNVPFIARTLDPQTAISANDQPLTAYTDYVALPFRGGQPRALDGVQVIWGGVAGDTTHALTAEQAAGKLVVLSVREGAPVRITAASPLAKAAGIAFVGGT